VRIARTPRLVLAHPRHVTRRPAAAAAGVVMTTGQSSGASGPEGRARSQLASRAGRQADWLALRMTACRRTPQSTDAVAVTDTLCFIARFDVLIFVIKRHFGW